MCTVCDARAAVYQKMGKLKEALRDSKTVIDAQPSRWQVCLLHLENFSPIELLFRGTHALPVSSFRSRSWARLCAW